MRISLLVVLLFAINSFAQDSLLIFDRPGVAESPYIVNINCWQIESGISYLSKTGISSSILPSIMIRKYLAYKTEVRLTMNYEPQMMGIILEHFKQNIDPVALGVKHKLWEEKNLIPEASILVNTYYPLQKLSSLNKNSIYNVEIGFQFQQKINKILDINYNIGTIFTNNYTKGIINYSICSNLSLTKNIGVFIEYFGYKPINIIEESGFDCGVIFMLNKHSQIDLSIINNIYQNNHYLSILLGYSFLIKPKS